MNTPGLFIVPERDCDCVPGCAATAEKRNLVELSSATYEGGATSTLEYAKKNNRRTHLHCNMQVEKFGLYCLGLHVWDILTLE